MTLRGIYTIPAGWPFVDALAAGILDEIGSDPAALADVIILLPTRRAVRSLREAFLRLSDGKPLLLPRMTPLGDIDEDELVIAGGDELSGGLDVPPAISGLRRQLLLARLVRKAQGDMPVEQAAMLALELARLIDRVRTERLSFDRLGDIVPEEHAEHWQQTLEFLKIVTQHWPDILAEEGAIDSADRRNRLLASEADRWRAHPPQGLVIAAGSTGSIPATADLLAVIPTLPRGVLVLPGFDPTVTTEVAAAALEDAQHPQHGMLRLLARLDEPTSRVKPWPTQPLRITHPDRAGLLSEIMRPADTTKAWRDIARPSAEALANLSRIDCPGADEEARVIALLMRDTLEQPGRTAALVTPDRTLARRVAAELRRWEIEIDDSAGHPLATTPVGAFLRLAAELVTQDFAPVSVLALAKHPLAACGLAPATLRRLIRRLEIAVLRGPRPAPGLAGLRAALTASRAKDEVAFHGLLDALESASTSFADLITQPSATLSDLVTAHIAMAEALARSDAESGASRLWAGDAGEAAAAFVSEAIEAAAALGEIPPRSYAGLIDALLGGRVVRPSYGAHPRLFIWGLLEARLQHADVMILGGLNEGTWPPDGEADPWMSRPMRKAFGLPPPERRIGLTAHDFAQAYAAPEVVLTRAARVDGTPTVPSRWLVKLEKILDKFELHPEEYSERTASKYLRWQALLDAPDPTREMRADRRPAPKPPVAARPRRLSVTQIETWMRDPYAIYARHILKLRELDPIDAAPDRADYGTIIHRILDEFIRQHPQNLPFDAYEQLSALGAEKFAERSVPPGVRAFWWPRFLRIARWIADTEPERRNGLVEIASEVTGEMSIDGPAGPFRVTAIADRIDRLDDGTLQIFDYKTGAAPSPKEVAAGFAPQLPLEAMIAMAGGFTGIKGGDISKLAFLRLSGGNPAGEEKPAASKETDPKTLADEARAGLIGLVASFDREDTPYEARPRPDMAPRYSAYEHLARVKEWAAGNDGEGGET
jgi:ATP-dependent helicase/nuclease subunit B